MPTRLERLEAHSSHLLDEFLKLRGRFAMLEPMLFDVNVIREYGAGKRGQGFLILRQSLFLSCVQDIAKYCLDKHDQTPSIRNIVDVLADHSIVDELRRRYAMWRFPNADKHDPEILEALRRMEAKEESQRQVRFDQLYADLQFSWSKLKSQPVLSAFCTVRDKLTAHTEIRFIADKYQLIDIGKLGIKWGDLKVVIAQMQHLVELIGLVVRNAGFAWDMLDEDLNEAANGFWVSEPDS